MQSIVISTASKVIGKWGKISMRSLWVHAVYIRWPPKNLAVFCMP